MLDPLPPLASIRAFEAAARLGSFAAAARELGMSGAAVSYHVRRLERAIGVRLFERHARTVALTAPGETVAAEAMRTFAALRASFARAADMDAARLTVSVLPTFATSWLVPRLGGLSAVQPWLHVEIDVADEPRELGAGRFDVAIRNGHGDWPGLESHELFPALFVPLCAPDRLQEAQALADPAAPLPRLLGRRDWWTTWLAAGGRSAPGDAAFGTTLATEHLDIAAAIAGQGIAIGSPILFADDIAAARLVVPHPRIGRDGRTFWLTYPRVNARVPKIEAFRDWILSEAAKSRAACPGLADIA
ncbi:LysR family transcriptional regulator [Sphingomonas panacisoli]|uniref:LysR family transcriptional regulator n=1 Tax=Sphingomonas panacisoli TaxID=1813879 RepID=A0A5B8LKX1_9SPHN|nr:LysR substrate-binding domain-containing protein [Sphingomonas panacisoli]QDZ08706.1 LysR family transcriptional regulator [Sphingomonas panacisoli]